MRKHLSPFEKKRAVSKKPKVKKSKILRNTIQNKYLKKNIFELKVNMII